MTPSRLPSTPGGGDPDGWRAARRRVAAWMAIGVALRIAFALVYWVDQPLTHDEREYLALARSVARGEGFHYPADEPSPGTGQQFGRAPGYPLFLSTIIVPVPVDHAPRRVKLAQAAVGAIGIGLIAAIAGRAAGARAAVMAAAIAAIYPPLVWMPAYVLSETLFSTMALAAALALSNEGRGARAGHLAGSVLTGLAILTRPAMLFFVPLAASWFWWRRRPVDAATFVLITALCVLPWTLRNHRVYGRWIAVASEGGVTFWTGNHPQARGDGDLAANVELKREELAFRASHPGLTPEQMEPLYYQDALSWIRREPGAWLTLLGRKAVYSVVPFGPSYAVHSPKYRLVSVVSYLVLLLLAVLGWRRWRQFGAVAVAPVPLWLMAGATIAAGLVFFPQERFRIPVIDPALIVTAALFAGLKERR